MATYMCLAITSQATARASNKSESQSSTVAWILNHRKHTSNANTTHPLKSPLAAPLAVFTTSFVITRLFGLVSSSSASSQGTTRSTWYFNRSATLVTSFDESGSGVSSVSYVGRTVQWQHWLASRGNWGDSSMHTSTPFHMQTMAHLITSIGAENVPPVTHDEYVFQLESSHS